MTVYIPVAPSAAPPNAHATPPNATTAISALSGGPANQLLQHPFRDLSDGLKIHKNEKKNN